jgi:hypothetical protein
VILCAIVLLSTAVLALAGAVEMSRAYMATHTVLEAVPGCALGALAGLLLGYFRD